MAYLHVNPPPGLSPPYIIEIALAQELIDLSRIRNNRKESIKNNDNDARSNPVAQSKATATDASDKPPQLRPR